MCSHIVCKLVPRLILCHNTLSNTVHVHLVVDSADIFKSRPFDKLDCLICYHVFLCHFVIHGLGLTQNADRWAASVIVIVIFIGGVVNHLPTFLVRNSIIFLLLQSALTLVVQIYGIFIKWCKLLGRYNVLLCLLFKKRTFDEFTTRFLAHWNLMIAGLVDYLSVHHCVIILVFVRCLTIHLGTIRRSLDNVSYIKARNIGRGLYFLTTEVTSLTSSSSMLEMRQCMQACQWCHMMLLLLLHLCLLLGSSHVVNYNVLISFSFRILLLLQEKLLT